MLKSYKLYKHEFCYIFSSDLLNKSLVVRSLDDFLQILVTTKTGNEVAFGDFKTYLVNFNVSIDTIVVDTWVNYFDNCITVDFLKNDLVRKKRL